MKYISTRDDPKRYGFFEAMILGLSSDGGLLLPEVFPKLEVKSLSSLSYRELAFEVFRVFISNKEVSDVELKKTIALAYSLDRGWRTDDVVKFRHTQSVNGEEICFLELFHGPTFAFKDVALQFLGQMFKLYREKETSGDFGDGDKRDFMVLGATSGDTGSAALAGLAACKGTRALILYPLGGTSAIQEGQMIDLASRDSAVKVVAVGGAAFDDCQSIVKELFMERQQDWRLVAVNSINWVRIMAQIVYYWKTAIELQARNKRKPIVVVPTGNFGNILAGHYAILMGAPIHELVVASNTNDILTEVFCNGNYVTPNNVAKTWSPSMDICISSNFERLVAEISQSGSATDKMNDLKEKGGFVLSKPEMEILSSWSAFSATDDDTLEAIRLCNSEGYQICPHTGVGVHAALRRIEKGTDNRPVVVVATAHPAKFPEAWTAANISSQMTVPAELSTRLISGIDSARQCIAMSKDAVAKEIQRLYEEC